MQNIRNVKIDCLVFGVDDGFYQRLQRFCIKRIQMISGIILRFPFECWSFFKYVAISIADIFIRQYIALITLVLSIFIFPASILLLRGDERIITAIYCLSFIASPVISLVFKRGRVMFAYQPLFEILEHQKLIAEFERENGQVADQPAGYGAKDKRQPFQRTLENLMEPRSESDIDPAIDFHHYCNADNNSAGPSSAPQCHCFTITNISDDSHDSDEPVQGPLVARLHPDAINFFGPPLQVFGADSYKVLYHSSDEDCASRELEKTFKVPDVQRSDSNRSLNSFNDGFELR